MSNPILSENKFSRSLRTESVMSIDGAVNKSMVLVGLTFVAAMFTYRQSAASSSLVTVTGILGFIIALIASFKPASTPVTAPLYAVVEGLFLGAVSYVYGRMFEGIVLQAVMLTFGTLFGMLGLYSLGIIRMSGGLSRFLFVATAGVGVTYLLTFILSFFGIQIPFIHDSGPIGIGFSAFVVILAALNLIGDFASIEAGAAQGAPKYMEWYSAFGLLVTLVWLYLEILRLLAKLSRRD
jgi:uncharacterized YccA/Bax inhibitor family protein